jgi:hypothetical protein
MPQRAGRHTVTFMTTLHIEHAISDYPTWKGAFGRFARSP